MILLYFFIALIITYVWGLYATNMVKYVYRKTNGSDFGFFLCFGLGMFPFVVVLQILVWIGVLH